MKNILIGFLFGLTLGAVLVFYGTAAQVKELEETNRFLTEKLKEKQ